MSSSQNRKINLETTWQPRQQMARYKEQIIDIKTLKIENRFIIYPPRINCTAATRKYIGIDTLYLGQFSIAAENQT